jgi:hypothetical protein
MPELDVITPPEGLATINSYRNGLAVVSGMWWLALLKTSSGPAMSRT